MEDACRLEVWKNESLFRSNSSSGGPSVLDILQNQLCPSNCSNNGYDLDFQHHKLWVFLFYSDLLADMDWIFKYHCLDLFS
jgi:hypothetical protein